MIKSNDDDRVQRALEEMNLDAGDEAASRARMFALLIIAGGFLFGGAVCVFFASLLFQ